MLSPHRGHAPSREWSVCSSAQRHRAVSRLIPSAPRAHGAWGGIRAAAGAAISPAASAIATRRARHPVLRASMRASAGTTSNPKSVMCAGTGTPGELDGGAEAPCESSTKHGRLSQRSPRLPRRREARGSEPSIRHQALQFLEEVVHEDDARPRGDVSPDRPRTDGNEEAPSPSSRSIV